MDLENSDESFKNLDKINCPHIQNDEIPYAFIPSDFSEKNNEITISPDTKIVVNETNEAFPFSNGEGLFNVLRKMGLNFKTEYSDKNESCKISFIKKFNIISNENGSEEKKRKYDTDNIKRNIKREIHSQLKNVVQEKLKECKIDINTGDFGIFQECFLTNVTYDFNKKWLNATYEELIKNDFTLYSKKNEDGTKIFSIIKENKKQSEEQKKNDKEKNRKNIEILDYLNKEYEIIQKSEFDKIKEMKYVDILKAYFLSKEFENYIINMFKKEEKEYIKRYINQALNYVNGYIKYKSSNENNK
jgi:hypothetical protein